MRFRSAAIVITTALLTATGARAECVNRFTTRADGPRHVVTLLTGKITFQEAKDLAAAIHEGKSAPLEWVDTNGKAISRQFGDLKVVRPMPVGCDGNSSGVVMIAIFPALQPPAKRMIIRLNATNTVAFDEQGQ